MNSHEFAGVLGTPELVDVHGRPGWMFTLAPFPGRPEEHALQVTFDVDTGILLRRARVGSPSRTQIIELHFHAELHKAVFVWSGPIASQ